MKYLGTIINSGLFSNIEESEYISVYKGLSVKGKYYKKGSQILREGEYNNKICIVHRGCVHSEKLHEDGEMHIIQLYQENMIFGLGSAISEDNRAIMSYICSEGSEIAFISMEDMMASEYRIQLNEGLMNYLAADNMDKLKKIQILGLHGLREKIMAALSMMAENANCDGEYFRIRMNQDQLAKYLCVNRSALSKELNLLKKEGIIDFTKDEFCIMKK